MRKIKNRGQGLVEFALILPILLMLLLGIIEGAHVIQAYISAQQAVREAARYAVSGQPLNSAGDPWTTTDRKARADIIKQIAVGASIGTGYTTPVTDTVNAPCYPSNCGHVNAADSYYDYYRRDQIEEETGSCPFVGGCTCFDCDGALAVRVGSWDAKTGAQSDWDDPGWEGDNLRVQLYNNVSIFDPIYASIAQAANDGPYLRIASEIVMRNEGGPPITGEGQPQQDNETPPGSGQPPPDANIYVQGGDAYPAGSPICIVIERHPPDAQYNIYVNGGPPGTQGYIGTISLGAQQTSGVICAYTIPVDQPPGTLQIASYTTGDVMKARGELIVLQSIIPAIVTGGDVWPLHSLLEYSLVSHPPLSATAYNIEMTDGGTPENLPGLSTDADGNSISATYTLDEPPFSAGEWLIQSIHPSTPTTPVATRTLTLTEGCIKLDQSNCGGPITVPEAVYINILLEKHAHNRAYAIKFVNTADSSVQDIDTITTDSNGTAFLVYQIPAGTANGNTYQIISEDVANPGVTIALANLEIFTPANAFIHVDGGYTWPAGSHLLFQLRQHAASEYYDIDWEGTRIITQSAAIPGSQPTNNEGMLWLSYDIPIDIQGTYHLQSHLHSDANPANYTAISQDITVTAVPYINIPEGAPQIPGAPVTVELKNHAINNRYDIYVMEDLSGGCGDADAPGRKLIGSPVTTDLNGEGELPYEIPSNVSGWVHIRSYPAGTTTDPAADYCLELIAADLIVTSIEVPDPPTFNDAMPITITVQNVSPVTITHKSFDVDVYLDLSSPPNIGRSLPPGDIKNWIQPPLGVNMTRSFTTPVYLYGATDHSIWARADTSARIVESNENNNLLAALVTPNICGIEYTAAVSWTVTPYGNTDLNAPPAMSKTLRLHANGSSTWNIGSNYTDPGDDRPRDDSNGIGFVYAYRILDFDDPGSTNTDFEVLARITSPDANAAKWGLEIRQGNWVKAPKLDWVYYNGWNEPQYLSILNRTNTAVTSFSNSSNGDFPDLPHPSTAPLWLRMTRVGSNITMYYSTANTDTPPTSWISGGAVNSNRFVDNGNRTRVGIVGASYSGNLKSFDALHFQICTPNCANPDTSAHNYNFDGTNSGGWSRKNFGDASGSSLEFIEESSGGYTPFDVDLTNDTITINNNGSSTWQMDDNAGGLLFGHHQLSGNFDVRVRAIQQDPYENGGALKQAAKFGLEVRSGLGSTDNKLDWLTTAQRGLQYQLRVNGSRVASRSDIGNTSIAVPVWLRIVRNGDRFTLYYSYESSNPPLNWIEQKTLTTSGMPDTVYLGLINSSYSSSLKNRVILEGYHVCGDPGETSGCGEVRESGGNVVINANNYISKDDNWQTASQGGKTGLATNSNGSPGGNVEIQYAVDFSADAANQDYYVWILGYARNSGDNSMYFGHSSSPPASGDYMSLGAYNQLTWFNGSSYTIHISNVGSTSLSVWAKEDGFEIYQILLTTNAGFDPSTDVADPNSIPQSRCSAMGAPPVPPGATQCDSGTINGNFEDGGLMSTWNYSSIAQQVTRTSQPHYFDDGSFSMLLPATNLYGLDRHPWLWQEFQMPTWVLTPTLNGGTSINLSANVAVNPEGLRSTPPEPLFALLRDQGGQPLDSISLGGPITFTTDAQVPSINPSNPSPNNSEWAEITVDLAQGFDPPESLLNYAGQPVRYFFESPNPANNYSTYFYLDNVELEVCTAQPRPESYSTKVDGEALVFLNGIPTSMPGVYVWIYAIDGAMEKSYTIQDSTFSFYDLAAADPDGTEYILYAEYQGPNDLYFASTTLVLHPGETISNISLLLIGP